MLRAALLAGIILSATPALADKPNIIVIMTDDQDAASIANMPKVRARMKDAAWFTSAVVNYPICSPSRATFMSGQFIQNHRIGFKGDENRGQRRFVRKGALPQWLQDAGYFTAVIGLKAMEGMGALTDLGFDHYAVVADHDDSRYFDPTLDVDGKLEDHLGAYTTDVFRAKANEFVRAADRPYFLFIPVSAPHAPALPAPRHVGACADVPFEPGPAFNEADMRDKPGFMAHLPLFDAKKAAQIEGAFRDRCETLLSVDELAADLIDRAGETTCVFLTSDHGLMSGQHRNTGKLLAAYEESIRVPLLMWGCGAPRGKRFDELVSNADLPSTILDLAGAESHRRPDGRSLLDLFAGAKWRTALPVQGAWEQAGGGTSECVRTTAMIYCSHSTGERELYDLEADPDQLDNLAAASPAVPALHRLAKDLNRCSAARCWFTGDPLGH